ncbi:MAG TPA: aminomethyl-transferring glycine dehydrogenase subunit GcvPB [Dehalococcoidia bacterium]|nr:aminomethyl-transferring glycine dehydrogenase subunit GcvPB [Dehalococcoidia bacterium]
MTAETSAHAAQAPAAVSPPRLAGPPELWRDELGAALSFDRGAPGKQGVLPPALDVPTSALPPAEFLRETPPRLPELSQLDTVRYYTALSRLNYSIDAGFYPLGSCTMKYNPKIDEDIARLPGFAALHPLQPEETVQGTLRLFFELQGMFAEIAGLHTASLAPMAGAQGEFAGILAIKAWLEANGRAGRRRVLVPDAAHGTNPATAAMCGFEVVSIPTAADGDMDLDALAAALDDRAAALMLTIPNTLGLFDFNILRIAELVHGAGALLYGDGANLNAIAGQVKPGELGFDVLHINVHKTLSTPHGGGGPGAGPIAVSEALAPYLPDPYVVFDEQAGRYRLVRPAHSIGRLGAYHGNSGVLVRAYTYLRTLGAAGLREMSESAVVSANYVQSRLKAAYVLPYDRSCMHESVFSGSRQRARGVRTLDIAKRLIDYGFHPPTVYFPLIVDEALMIEPTEAEGKDALDAFCEAMLAIAREAEESPELLREAPQQAPLRRLDEATAARKPVLRWRPGSEAAK